MGGGFNSTPQQIYPLERPGTYFIGGWVFPRALWKDKENLSPHRDSIPGPSSPWRVAVPTELSRPTYIDLESEYYCQLLRYFGLYWAYLSVDWLEGIRNLTVAVENYKNRTFTVIVVAKNSWTWQDVDEKLMRQWLITNTLFWVVTSYCLLDIHQRDGDSCCLHFEGLLLNVMCI